MSQEEATGTAAHEHVHTHADGTTHSHPHVHEGDHQHGHGHEHHHAHGHHHHHHGAEGAPAGVDEKLAMLRYMLGHNRDHAEELAGLSMGAGEEAEAVLAHAVEHYNQANELLAEYIGKVEAN